MVRLPSAVFWTCVLVVAPVACGRIGYETRAGSETLGGAAAGGVGEPGGGTTAPGGTSGAGGAGNAAGSAGVTSSGGVAGGSSIAGSSGWAGAPGLGGAAGGAGGTGGGTGGTAGGAGETAGGAGAAGGTGGTAGGAAGGDPGTGGTTAGTGGTGACTPTNGGIEICDALDNDCANGVDGGGVCAPTCTTGTYGGVTYAACSDLRGWETAAANCEYLGMRLLRIDDADEQASMMAFGDVMTSGQDDVWIGGNDLAVSEDWAWTDGEVFYRGLRNNGGAAIAGAYTNFDPSDPNHLTPAERCITFRPATLRGYWYDIRCTDALPYLCEAY